MSESLDLDLDIGSPAVAPVPRREVAVDMGGSMPPKPPDVMSSLGWFIAIILAVVIGFKLLLSMGSNVVPPRPLSDRYDLFVIDDLQKADEGSASVMAADQFWADLKQNHGMDWRFYDLNKSEEIQGTKLQKRAREIGEAVIVVQEKSGEVLYCEKMQGTTDGVRKQIGKWLK